MNHYISDAYEDLALERIEVMKQEAELRRLVREARSSMPKQPNLFLRLRDASWNAIRAIRLPSLRPAHKSSRRYANRTA